MSLLYNYITSVVYPHYFSLAHSSSDSSLTTSSFLSSNGNMCFVRILFISNAPTVSVLVLQNQSLKTTYSF